jgi:hypothetical protein
MTTRTCAFAPLSAILIAAFLSAALRVPAAAATDVPITDFEGAWSASLTYNPGAVVTASGASYICLVQNTHFAPATHPQYWKILDAAGATGATGPAGPQGPPGPAGPTGPSGTQGLFGSNSLTFLQGSSGVTCDLASLMLSASNLIPAGYVPADGRLLLISQNAALWNQLGTNYGGDGTITFALPDLRAAAPNNTIYLICVIGDYP